jgi:hypothetical protein
VDDFVYQRGLAVVDVGDDRNVANAAGTLHRKGFCANSFGLSPDFQAAKVQLFRLTA